MNPEISSEESDEEEAPIITNKKKFVMDDSFDDNSNSLIEESRSRNASGRKSYKESDFISESDEADASTNYEVSFSSPSQNKPNTFSTPKLTLTGRTSHALGNSFITPQNKKLEIDDSDTDESNDNSDVIDDSFNAETPKISVGKKKEFVSPSTGHVVISSDSDEPGTLDIDQNNKPAINNKVQAKLDDLFKKLTPSDVQSPPDNRQSKIECTRTEYNDQMLLIRSEEQQMLKAKKLMSTVNMSNLPDKGHLLKVRFEESKAKFLEAQNRLRIMVVVKEDVPVDEANANSLSDWNNLQAGLATVQPKTFGKKGLANYQNQKALTVESLELLHGSLKNCPKDDQLADQPKGLKVDLMGHQKRALAWMIYREQQKPPGGILADDMGLGKTLTMISLVLKMKENQVEYESTDEEQESLSKRHKKYDGGTLVVCPASLLNQWAQEIDTKLRRGMLSYNVYHGPKREVKPKRLAEHDVVITTYSIVMNEMDREGAIFRVRWGRIILDEAHQIRNHKAQTSVACCTLSGKYRWALTGTPIHNKELDMYALLKFLRCSPFDDLTVWKRWVGDKSSGGGERLNTVISSVMLRRTKAELMAQGKMDNLPARKWELIPVTLDESEMSVYQKILLFSQTLFAQFLHQRAEKGQDIINIRSENNGNPNSEYFKMRKKLLALNQMREVNQHDILVLLLRLRQICCHPSLITNMLQGDEDLGDDEPEEKEEINLLEQLDRLKLDDQPVGEDYTLSTDKVGFKEATKGILNPSHPLFAKDRISSKIECAMKLIPNILSSGDKIIVVSQWTSFLELVGWQLKEAGIKFTQLDGSVPTAKRTDMVTNFNDPNTRVKVLLLSLTAGGVGLNLVGANHLFLLDLHWNPQLEHQAQDRIYRIGQKKEVNVYKFMASDTIEERIKKLQENKVEIAESMLTGSKRAIGNKLSLHDLKMLFNM